MNDWLSALALMLLSLCSIKLMQTGANRLVESYLDIQSKKSRP